MLLLILPCMAFTTSAASTASTNNPGTLVENEQQLQSIYSLFSETIAKKDKSGHMALYLYDSAPVSIILKTQDGPIDIYNTDLDNFSSYITSLTVSHELNISEESYTFVSDKMAFSVARFDGLMDSKANGSGTDVFAYVKARDGWKLAALHNTVVDAGDETDYSTPTRLNTDIRTLPGQLGSAIKNKNRKDIMALFHNPLGQFINLDYGDNFTYFNNSIAGMANRVSRAPYELSYEFSDIEAKVFDQYIAVLTMNYKAKINGEQRASGKQMWFLYATAASDWRIANIIYHSVDNAPG